MQVWAVGSMTIIYLAVLQAVPGTVLGYGRLFWPDARQERRDGELLGT